MGSSRFSSIRREYLIVFSEEHLLRIIAKYANEVRTHVSLGKDAPCTRAIERCGYIVAHPILGGYIIDTQESDFSEATATETWELGDKAGGTPQTLASYFGTGQVPLALPSFLGGYNA
jgi:hypothetical protein